MSLIGEKTSIVSLGSSCQTAHQIKQNAQLLSELAGDALAPRRLPFDWLICPIGRMAEWIEAGEAFPHGVDELSPYRQEGTFHWQRRGLFFWHDFRKQPEPLETFDAVRDKYRNLFRLFHDLRSKQSLVFVISNTQNNLEEALGEDYAAGGFTFTPDNLHGLRTVLDQWFGTEYRLLCVTYAERSAVSLEAAPEERTCVMRLTKDQSEWKGDDAQWRSVLERFFRQTAGKDRLAGKDAAQR